MSPDRLPQSAHLLDSLDAAIHVIRDTPAPEPLPRAVSEELWHIIRSMAPLAPVQEPVPSPDGSWDSPPASSWDPAPVSASVPEPAPASGRFTWREWFTIGCVAGAAMRLARSDDGAFSWGLFLFLFILLVGPTAWLARLAVLSDADEGPGCSVLLMAAAVVFSLIVLF